MKPLTLRIFVLSLLLAVGGVTAAHAQAGGDPVKKRVDVESVQGVLAVQSLDGWLLADSKGKNSIAVELVVPEAKTSRQWFYFIPSFGQPSILVHKSEALAFVNVPGTKIEYSGYRDLKTGLRTLLGSAKNIAMEYAPKSGIASLTRVDSSTISMVKKSGVSISSSADLVQFTKSLWGPEGRVAHYVAVHHLTKLRDEALAFVSERVSSKRPVSEHDVRAFLDNGYRARGLRGTISVAIGDNTAKPNYVPSVRSSRAIKEGHLLVLRLTGAVIDSDRPIHASLSWVAYVGETVPERFHRVFRVVSAARDTAIGFIKSRASKRRLLKGFEADQLARGEIGKSGMASRFLHRTGHSLDTSLHGDGANLDDYESHDTRNLVVGSGFTVGPGLYMTGDFGIQTTVSVHMIQGDIEVSTPLQTRITPIL
ncbi:MAG: M24 family metallopeptidase [Myxococcales bacterium]|nr:M24 family metallopeptidase [Myxococcales bacterium]